MPKKIGKELDKLTGRKKTEPIQKKQKRSKKDVDPSGAINNTKQLRDIYNPKKGLGFFSFILLSIIVIFSIVGVIKTFENDLIYYFPEVEYFLELLNIQLEYFSETFKNMIIIVKDLIDSY